MYLRDIQLDLSYRENSEILSRVMSQCNCTYEEAIRIDYDNNWKWEVGRRFDLETRCIVSMFLRLLGKYKNKDSAKILIDCVEKTTLTDYSSVFGICLVQYELDYIDFFNKNNYAKKQAILQIVKESICNIAKEKDWDLTPFEYAFNKIEELEYKNFWVFGKKSKSPSKLYTAELYLEHKIEAIDFFVVIRNKQGEIVEKKLIITESPSEWVYTKYLGKLVWVSDTEIHLNNKAGVTLCTIAL